MKQNLKILFFTILGNFSGIFRDFYHTYSTLVIFSPIFVEQLAAVGLSPFINRWNRVHNFTPETAKYRLVSAVAGGTEHNNSASAEAGLVECAMNERFRREFLDDGNGSLCVHNLTFSPHASFFFHTTNGGGGGEGCEAEVFEICIL